MRELVADVVSEGVGKTVAPEVRERVSRLANNRLGGPRGLQSIIAESVPDRAFVLGHRWDASCADRAPVDRSRSRDPGRRLSRISVPVGFPASPL